MMAPRFLLPADGLKTESENPSFIQVKKDARTERGSPSPLTKRLGNLHAKARPLRQALYARMLINKVTEVYPEWDWESKQVMWVKIEVFPDKRGEYSEAVVPVGEGDVMCAVMDNRSLVIVTKTRKMEVLILDLKSLEEATLEVEATLLSDEIISAIDMNESDCDSDRHWTGHFVE